MRYTDFSFSFHPEKRGQLAYPHFYYHPLTRKYQLEEPPTWREPTPEEYALYTFKFAEDWVLRGTPDKPATSDSPFWYSAKLGAGIPEALGYLRSVSAAIKQPTVAAPFVGKMRRPWRPPQTIKDADLQVLHSRGCFRTHVALPPYYALRARAAVHARNR